MNTKPKEINTFNEFDAELNKLNTVSSRIRFLNSKGLTRSEIAKKLNKRYQHVRNVLVNPLKNDK